MWASLQHKVSHLRVPVLGNLRHSTYEIVYSVKR